jgi:predicted SAM-dependent methyltransferase
MKLNLGCGEDVREGFINIDLREDKADLWFDVGSPLDDWPASMVRNTDHILAKDVLEHFPQVRVREVLSTWFDLLKPGGTIEIEVPDILFAVEMRHNDDWLIQLLYGGQDYPENFHQAGFTIATMRRQLEATGFTDIKIENDSYGNMIARAAKP